MTDGILLRIDGGLARVTFDRPASLNASTRSRPTPRWER
ncbi:MAG: hypothetical protein K0R81_2366 [Microbacterium sp.]|nr:hypothetical protein [Microbacterium sp.]